ncbi:MAG: tetratricopeptide repeat protein [Bryobacteraceae bacterium]|jgi:tetratricopeptide (TPR) repeat protein
MWNLALFPLLIAITAVSLPAQMGTTPVTGSGGQTSIQANPNLGSGGGSKAADASHPIYVSGKVVMDDGSAVLQNITIERVCSGISKTVAYTDSNGRFNFRWGDANMVVADASDAGSGPTRNSNSGGFGSSQSAGGANALAADPFGNRMMNCGVRAVLAGYSSDAVSLFNRQIADNPDIGSIVLHRIAGVEGSSISVTSMRAPKAAKSAYERGLQSLLKNKPSDAAKDFEKAVALYPNYADAWVNLAKLRLTQQSVEPARAALTKAMEADPKLVAPYLELGLLAAKDAKWEESGRYLDRAVELDPIDFPQAWYTDAVANYNLKKYDAAEKSARAAVKLDQRHVNPRSDYLLGLVLVEKKDYAGAAEELTMYMKLAPNAPDLAQVKDRLGQIEKLAGAPK